jgi:AcrR family transcriptional regulator
VAPVNEDAARGTLSGVTATATGDRHQDQKRRTRATLERVAVELFAARGFDHVTIDEIVAAAQVSKRTFYRYYEAKEDLLLSEQRRILDRIHAAVVARPAGERLLDAFANALRDLRREPRRGDGIELEKARLLFATPSLATRIIQHQLAFEDSFAGMIADRLGVTDPDDPRPAMLAAALLGALRVITQRWLATPDLDFGQDLARQLDALRTALPEL